MGSTEILIVGLISLVLTIMIIRGILQTAANSKKIELQMRVQTLLLAKMSQKAGVSVEEINKIIKPVNHVFAAIKEDQ